MKSSSTRVFIALAGVLFASMVSAGAPQWQRAETTVVIERIPLTEQQRWILVSGTGEEIYTEFCGSCHGADGTGSPLAGDALETTLPNLTILRASEYPGRFSSGRVYNALASDCGSKFHRGVHGNVTMPCWQRILDQSLKNEAQVFFVRSKLVSHISSFQQ